MHSKNLCVPRKELEWRENYISRPSRSSSRSTHSDSALAVAPCNPCTEDLRRRKKKKKKKHKPQIMHCLVWKGKRFGEKRRERERDTTSSLPADFKVETRTVRHYRCSVLVRKNGGLLGVVVVVYVSLFSVWLARKFIGEEEKKPKRKLPHVYPVKVDRHRKRSFHELPPGTIWLSDLASFRDCTWSHYKHGGRFNHSSQSGLACLCTFYCSSHQIPTFSSILI